MPQCPARRCRRLTECYHGGPRRSRQRVSPKYNSRMVEIADDFYDHLAPGYHLIFEDWEASMARQAAALGPILERECGPAESVRVLDCACGIGTQALGLARLGFQLTGADLSRAAIDRARVEASLRGLDIPFYISDMRHLSRIQQAGFDAVICMDNALPHLLGDEHLAQAAAQIRAKLRDGGALVASIRDYDRLIVERPVVHGPAFHSDGDRRRIVFQLWDWIDERRYRFHLYITRETLEGWTTYHGAAEYRALLRDELTRILEITGFAEVRWLFPVETGFYQPIVLARAGGGLRPAR